MRFEWLRDLPGKLYAIYPPLIWNYKGIFEDTILFCGFLFIAFQGIKCCIGMQKYLLNFKFLNFNGKQEIAWDDITSYINPVYFSRDQNNVCFCRLLKFATTKHVRYCCELFFISAISHQIRQKHIYNKIFSPFVLLSILSFLESWYHKEVLWFHFLR